MHLWIYICVAYYIASTLCSKLSKIAKWNVASYVAMPFAYVTKMGCLSNVLHIYIVKVKVLTMHLLSKLINLNCQWFFMNGIGDIQRCMLTI